MKSALLVLAMVAAVGGYPLEDHLDSTQNKCFQYCQEKHTNEKQSNACRQGCTLFGLLNYGSSEKTEAAVEGARKRCSSSCQKAYEGEDAGACQDGCNNQQPYNGGRFVAFISNDSPLYEYSKGAFNKIFDGFNSFRDRIFSPFQSLESSKPDEVGEEGGWEWRVPDLGETHRREMARLRQLASILDTIDRPQVQNQQSPVMLFRWEQVQPQPDEAESVEGDRAALTNGEPDPNLYTVDPENNSWLWCLSARARRLSRVTRTLVCAALLLCVLCMLWICLAIIKTAPRSRLMHGEKRILISTVDPVDEKFMHDQMSLLNAQMDAIHQRAPPPPYTDKPKSAAY